jgi:hypothetical protein
MSFDRKFRLTVDEELAYYEIRQLAPNFLDKNIFSDDVILELKYALNDDKLAGSVGSYIPFRLTKNSKYVNGIGLLRSIPV